MTRMTRNAVGVVNQQALLGCLQLSLAVFEFGSVSTAPQAACDGRQVPLPVIKSPVTQHPTGLGCLKNELECNTWGASCRRVDNRHNAGFGESDFLVLTNAILGQRHDSLDQQLAGTTIAFCVAVNLTSSSPWDCGLVRVESAWQRRRMWIGG